MRTGRRCYAAAAVDGKWHAACGTGIDGAVLDSVECYDPERDDWNEGTPLPPSTRDDLPEPVGRDFRCYATGFAA